MQKSDHNNPQRAQGMTVEENKAVLYRLANGTIVEGRGLWDRLGAWQQLGVLPDQDALNQRRTQG
jgi:hypothetical protein